MRCFLGICHVREQSSFYESPMADLLHEEFLVAWEEPDNPRIDRGGPCTGWRIGRRIADRGARASCPQSMFKYIKKGFFSKGTQAIYKKVSLGKILAGAQLSWVPVSGEYATPNGQTASRAGVLGVPGLPSSAERRMAEWPQTFKYGSSGFTPRVVAPPRPSRRV